MIQFSDEYTSFLDEILTRDMRVLEFGSGGSTLFFSRRVKSVLSYESIPKWHVWMTSVLNRKKIANVSMVLYTRENIEKLFPVGGFDCILIDSVISSKSVSREWLLKRSIPLLTGDKVLVLDNYGVSRFDKETDRLLAEKYESDTWLKMMFDRPGWKGKGTIVFYDGYKS